MTTSLFFPCGLKSLLAQCINPLHWLERMNLLLVFPRHGQPALMERSREADGKSLDCFYPSCTCFVKWSIHHLSHQHYCRSCGAAARQWPVASLRQVRHMWVDWLVSLPSSHILGVWFSALLEKEQQENTWFLFRLLSVCMYVYVVFISHVFNFYQYL